MGDFHLLVQPLVWFPFTKSFSLSTGTPSMAEVIKGPTLWLSGKTTEQKKD